MHQTKTVVETATATITDEVTVIHTAVVTDMVTDRVVVTQLSTVVEPTTLTKVYVSTNIIDNVRMIIGVIAVFF